jgi:hypothetical protein
MQFAVTRQAVIWHNAQFDAVIEWNVYYARIELVFICLYRPISTGAILKT